MLILHAGFDFLHKSKVFPYLPLYIQIQIHAKLEGTIIKLKKILKFLLVSLFATSKFVSNNLLLMAAT